MVEKLNAYAMALLTASVAVSSILRVLGLHEKAWAKPVLSVCFDIGGALTGFLGSRGQVK